MKYAVLQNSTQEIIDWFRQYRQTSSCRLGGMWDYLIYDSLLNETEYNDFPSPDTQLLTPKEFTEKFITKENMKTITYEQAQSIIDVACNSWKKKLFELWGESIVYKKGVKIEEVFYKEMRKACTKEQHILFDDIFGKDNIPEKGTLVYVHVSKNGEIYMRFYSHYEKEKHYCFNNQQKEEKYTTSWNYVSLTNPLIEEPKYI